MLRLSDFYSNILKKPVPTQYGITCEEINPAIAKLNQLLTDSVSCFSYTLILSGSLLVNINDTQISFAKNDLLIYTPGIMIRTLDVSDDFSALCLMAEEGTTYEIPFARNVICASFFPGNSKSGNKYTLIDCEPEWMEKRMREISTYIHSDHVYKRECLYALYSLFILDLLHVESRQTVNNEFNSHTIDLFLKFLRSITENYLTHHDIAFYADKLAVSPIYLSRIVKRISGQTVKNHIDRLLIIEASYLLTSSDMPVSAISQHLNFANQAGFCKFFIRNKGMTPSAYRESNISLNLTTV